MTALQDFVAGWCGGVSGLLVGHPFDTVKARLQTDGFHGEKSYKGTFHCFRSIIVKEGALSLYKGMASPLVGMAVINAMIFGVQGNMMRYLQPGGGPPKIVNSSVAGAIAGAVQTIICCPMELIKLRLQMQKEPIHFLHHERTFPGIVYSDPIDAIKKIAKKDGILGLNKGYLVTLYREIPAFAAYFATYDYLCQLRITRTEGMCHDDLSVPYLCVAGGFSGIVAWIVTYPLDVIKSRIQVDGMYVGEEKYTGIMDCFRKSYRESGYRVFFKGLNSTIIRAFPVNSATFVTVAFVLRYMRGKNGQE